MKTTQDTLFYRTKFIALVLALISTQSNAQFLNDIGNLGNNFGVNNNLFGLHNDIGRPREYLGIFANDNQNRFQGYATVDGRFGEKIPENQKPIGELASTCIREGIKIYCK